MKRIATHLLLWIAYALVEYAANLPHYPDRRELLWQTVFFLPVIAMPFYFTAYFLVPRLLWNGRKTLFWISCGALFFAVMVLRLEWTHWYVWWWEGEHFRIPLSKITKNLFRDYAVIGFAVSLKIIRDWDRKDRLATRLSQEKREAELQFLRAQIHPHFLFNTLNNLYGLAMAGSPNTSESILKLSGLLDFMLYQCNSENIPLEREIELIRHYVELERLRFGKRLDLQFECEHVEKDILIAPLLLLPFVENAFKHGAGRVNGVVSVLIRLETDARHLHFRVENPTSPGMTTGEKNGGIGLINVEKRLNLLYPEKFRLAFDATASNRFIATLQIDLP